MNPDAALVAHLDELLFSGAHTAYRFCDDPVDDQTLARVYELVRWAPTSMNTQPLRVLFLRGAAKTRLLPHLDEGNRPKSSSAPVVALLCYDEKFVDHLPYLLPGAADPLDDFPDNESVLESARFNSALQAGYFILAARSLGLVVGPMNGFDPVGARSELLAERAHWHPFLVVNLGHPAADAFRPRRPRLDTAAATLVLDR
jgi:3-hydroxypropanoate dehydrogenase